MTLPNWITAARIAITAALYPFVYLDLRNWFVAGYLVACATDALDGYLARRLNLVSYLGMRLDSFADYFLMASTLIWAARLIPAIYRENQAQWIAMAVAVAIPQCIALVRLGKNAGFHLYTTQAAVWAGFFLFTQGVVAGHYSRVLLAVLLVTVLVKSAEETLVCLMVDDPYAAPRRTVLAYIRQRRQV